MKFNSPGGNYYYPVELPVRPIVGKLEYVAYVWAFNSPEPDISDVLVHRLGRYDLAVWEPLLTTAPGPEHAKPWCCYNRTVIFYARPYQADPARPGEWLQYDQIETRLGRSTVRFCGGVYDMENGRVTWAGDRWWMVSRVRDKTRTIWALSPNRQW